jgi:hypothetical protein
METERITLSQRERYRLKVLHEVQQKHLTHIAAAEPPSAQSALRAELSQKFVPNYQLEMNMSLKELSDCCARFRARSVAEKWHSPISEIKRGIRTRV